MAFLDLGVHGSSRLVLAVDSAKPGPRRPHSRAMRCVLTTGLCLFRGATLARWKTARTRGAIYINCKSAVSSVRAALKEKSF